MIAIDMEMPDCCDECPFITARPSSFDCSEQFCPYLYEVITNPFGKLENCPLREVNNDSN